MVFIAFMVSYLIFVEFDGIVLQLKQQNKRFNAGTDTVLAALSCVIIASC